MSTFDFFGTAGSGDAVIADDGKVQAAKLAQFHARARAMERTLLGSLEPHFHWGVKLPLPPAAPLLYAPECVNTMFDFNGAGEVAEADVQGMGEGVLDDLSIAYYALRPWDMEEMRCHVEALEREDERKLLEDRRRGLPVRMLPQQRKNPLLDDEDFELVDVDFHDDVIYHRQQPSLALLREPIYADTGLVHHETRAQRRKERHLNDLFPAPPVAAAATADGGGGGLVSQEEAATQDGGGGGAPLSPGGAAALPVPYGDHARRVRSSFRNAASYDVKFDAILALVAEGVLFLDTAPTVVPETPSQGVPSQGSGDGGGGGVQRVELDPAVRQVTLVLLKAVGASGASPGGAARLLLGAARGHLQAFADGTPAAMLDARAAVSAARDEDGDGDGDGDGDAAVVERWLVGFAAVLESHFLREAWGRCAAVAEATSLERVMAIGAAFATGQEEAYKQEPTRLSLAHPSRAGVFPTQVLPLLPFAGPDDVDVASVPQPDAMAALSFNGVAPLAATAAQPMLVGDGELLLPATRDGESDTATYRSETTLFDAYLDDPCSRSAYVALVDDEAVRLKRVPRVAQFHRRVARETHTAKQYVVVWDAADPDAAPPPAAATAPA